MPALLALAQQPACSMFEGHWVTTKLLSASWTTVAWSSRPRVHELYEAFRTTRVDCALSSTVTIREDPAVIARSHAIIFDLTCM